MKKITIILLVVIACFGVLLGCGEKKVETSDFDSSTNQNKTIKGVSFEIPKKWESGDNTDELQYYYPEDGMLMVTFQESEGKIIDEDLRKIYIDSFGSKMDKFKIISESEIEVDGNIAYHEEMNFRLEGKDYIAEMVIFDSDDGLIGFTLGILKESGKNYSKDFGKIINSISKPLPFKKTIKDVDDLLNVLKADGKCNFTAQGFGEGSSTPMMTWSDSEYGLSIVAVGNRDSYVTTIHASANDEESFVKVCAMTLIGVDVLSPNASEFLTNLSSDNLIAMEDGIDGAKTEVIDGVSYILQKDSSNTKKYSLLLQRDKETKEDYENN